MMKAIKLATARAATMGTAKIAGVPINPAKISDRMVVGSNVEADTSKEEEGKKADFCVVVVNELATPLEDWIIDAAGAKDETDRMAVTSRKRVKTDCRFMIMIAFYFWQEVLSNDHYVLSIRRDSQRIAGNWVCADWSQHFSSY